MKKQILFLMSIAAVFMLFSSKVNAQVTELDYIDAAAVNCPAPTPLGNCAADTELNPIPGKTYTYEISVNPAVSSGNIRWYVYNATANGSNIITGGSMVAAIAAAEADGGTSQYLLDAEDGVYNLGTGVTQTSIDISWQSFDGSSTQILLIAYVEGELCADNIEVWRIEPSFAFTLDIAGLMEDGTTNYGAAPNANECISLVEGASYDGTNLTMDYGEDYIFFVVTAANFVHSWQPTFTIKDNTTETTVGVGDVEWAYPDQAISATGTWNAATDVVLAQDASGAVGDAGECIVVRVYLDHGNAENDAATGRSITLGVNGIMYNIPTTDYSNTDLADMDPGDTAPCTQTDTDKATFDLTPRPEIIEANPAAPSFEPKN